MADVEEMLFNSAGKPVGKYRARRPMTKKEREWSADFCERVFKNIKEKREVKEAMANQNNQPVNKVRIEGVIESINVTSDNGFMLVNTEEGDRVTKWLPCTCYKDDEILRALQGLSAGDRVRVDGYLRAWSQKKNEEWRNNVDVRIGSVAVLSRADRGGDSGNEREKSRRESPPRLESQQRGFPKRDSSF